jgi:alkanesulfonate monooxygenase SsuD/methylene tetrahydromethanopterin reductase-like flavin-dependent oxidoreductase (luciferase family)
MQFDLFYELSMPPFTGRSEQQVYEDALSEIVLADSLGFGRAWMVEHHFMGGYSHSSQPDLFLAAASQRTKQIRLGLGIIPLPLHHPVHVAERIATLDILSGGRVDVGIGRGFSPREYGAFNVDMAESRSLTQESLDILRLAFSRQPVTYHGKHFHLDKLSILPQIIQTPSPPLWSATVSPESFEWSAREYLGMLAGPFKPWLMTKHDISRYRENWRGNTPPRIGMAVCMLCLRDEKRVKKLAGEAFNWFYGELYKTTLPVLEKMYPSYEHFHDLGKFRHLLKLGINLPFLQTFGMVVAGTPEQCITALKKYQEAGVTHMLLSVGAGAVPTEIVKESLHCIAEDVMPAFTSNTDR